MNKQRSSVIEHLTGVFRHLHRGHFAHRANTVFRWVRSASTVAIVTASIWFIWTKASSGYATISAATISLTPQRIAVSLLCTAASTALGAWEWTLLVKALGAQLSVVTGMRICLVSNLAKYVPGFVWPYIGRAYQATRQGVPINVAILSIVIEFAIVQSNGALLALLCLPFSGIVSWSLGQRITLQTSMILLTAIYICSIPFAGRRLASIFKNPGAVPYCPEKVNWPQVTFVVVAVLLTWCLLGLGFATLGIQGASFSFQQGLQRISALASAMVMGQIVLFAPMGIGVREAVLVALLDSGSPVTLIVLLAVVFRLEILGGELVCALAMVVIERFSRTGQEVTRQVECHNSKTLV